MEKHWYNRHDNTWSLFSSKFLTNSVFTSFKAETHGEYKCPLCPAWFDTKTGLSNHVRGHLKRIGRSVTSTMKSPLSFLNKLLQEKQEHQNILQVLDKDQLSSPSEKLLCSKGLVLVHRSVPLRSQQEEKSPYFMLDNYMTKQGNADTEKMEPQVAAQRGTMTFQSSLVELLKKREERAGTNKETCAERKLCGLSKGEKVETEMTSVGTKWLHGERTCARVSIFFLLLKNTLFFISNLLLKFVQLSNHPIWNAGDSFCLFEVKYLIKA